MKTHAEIDAELTMLEQVLPKLIDECEPDEVLKAFAVEAEALAEQADEKDSARIHDRIQCLLSSAGLIPGETEGEPCTSTD